MTKGTLHSRGGNYFLPDGEKRPLAYSEKAMNKRGAGMLPPDFLAPLSAPLEFPAAYLCPDCRKIIIEY